MNSGFTDYTAAVARQLLLIGVLVTILLGGGLLILNLGLLSKRREDKVGRRAPSEVGILKGTMWPEESDEETVLPAEEEPEKQRRHDRAA